MSLNNSGTQNLFVFPIHLSSEPIRHLLIMDFKNDSEFIAIEPQLYDHPVKGKGIRILLYRKDKKIDVYWQSGVQFDPNSFNVGAGLGNYSETEMSPQKMEITEQGVYIDIGFDDILGRKVSFCIKENSNINNRFPFLAPVGSDVENPDKLFLVYMKEFDFIKRKGTTISVTIGNRKLTPSNFPITRDSQKVFFARYASNPIIGEINKGLFKPIISELFPGLNEIGDTKIILNDRQQVSKTWIELNSEKIEIEFDPGFPNLPTIPNQKKVFGAWKYFVSNQVITGGTYCIFRKENLAEVELNVTQKWKPLNIPIGFKLLIYIARFFRTWPATYKWYGTINLHNYSLVKSEWIRKNKNH